MILMTQPIAELGEKRLLQQIKAFLGKSPKIVRSFSEDCAVLDLDGDTYQLFTTDSMIEGIHFEINSMPPFYLGRKAIKVNVSDISAMGGKPEFYMVSLAAPGGTPVEMIQNIYEGMNSVADSCGMICIGGNLSRSEQLIVDIFMIGSVPKDQVIFRSGARVGDDIFVTGNLGGSSEGLALLRDGFRLLAEKEQGLVMPDSQRDSHFVYECILSHLDPPDLNEIAQTLARSRMLHSMIDLSDGLASDLPEICRESRVGAILDLASLPISPGTLYWERKRKRNPAVLALQGGEDYHLLFTASPENSEQLVREVGETKLFRIGEIVEEKDGIMTVDNSGRKEKLLTGFEHFKP
jgi:thiamine-monophosphate kinase